MGLKDSFLLRDPDKMLAIAGIPLSILMIIMGMMIGRLMYSLTGILALISCSLWLAIRNNHPFEFHPPESRTLTIFSAACFFGLYSLSVLALHFRPELYERPLLYFVLTALMAGLIACEIFTSGRRYTPFILIQILILGVSIVWSQLLIFPSLLGIDPWYHSALTSRIIDEGFIPEGYAYTKLPLFHLMIAVTSLISSLLYKLANMVSVNLGQIICNAIFVFLIARYLFKNHRVGLLAALLVILANHLIRMTYWSIPNAFGIVFIPIVIYLALLSERIGIRHVNRPLISAIIIMMMVAIILTHSIAAICMIIILCAAWGSLTIYQTFYEKVVNYIPLLVPFSFTVMTFAWWTYASGHLKSLGSLIRWGFSVDYFVKTPVEFFNYAVHVPLKEQVFNNLGIYLFFVTSLIGVLYMISRKGNGLMFSLAAIAVAPLATVFLSFVLGTEIISTRWFALAQLLLSIPLAVAIYLIVTWKPRRSLIFQCLMTGFVIVLSFLMIMSTPANIDNHMFSQTTGVTYAYTQSEMVGSDFFAANAIGVISSDGNYCTNPSSSVFSHAYGISPERLHCLDASLVTGEFKHDGSVKIIRSKCLQEPMIRGGLSLSVRSDLNSYVSDLGFNRIYVSSAVSGYTG